MSEITPEKVAATPPTVELVADLLTEADNDLHDGYGWKPSLSNVGNVVEIGITPYSEDGDRLPEVHFRAVVVEGDGPVAIASPALLAEVETLRAQRDRLLALHEYDEFIFGGFYCVHCTAEDCDDPDDNVFWPCPSLRAVGVTDDEGNQIITARRAEIARKAALEAGAR